MLILTKAQCLLLINDAPEAVNFISAIYVVENEMYKVALSFEEYELFVVIVKSAKAKDLLVPYEVLRGQFNGQDPELYEAILSELQNKNIIHRHDAGVKLAILNQQISIPISNDSTLHMANLITAAFKLALFTHANRLLQEKTGQVRTIVQPGLLPIPSVNTINPRQLHHHPEDEMDDLTPQRPLTANTVSQQAVNSKKRKR